MEKINLTRSAVEKLERGVPLTEVLRDTSRISIGDYLFQFLSKTTKSVETIAGLADLNKSSLYRILNAEISPQRNVLLRLSRILEMNLPETQKLLKIAGRATLSGSSSRDVVIISGILKEQEIMDICDNLSRNGYPDLFAKMK